MTSTRFENPANSCNTSSLTTTNHQTFDGARTVALGRQYCIYSFQFVNDYVYSIYASKSSKNNIAHWQDAWMHWHLCGSMVCKFKLEVGDLQQLQNLPTTVASVLYGGLWRLWISLNGGLRLRSLSVCGMSFLVLHLPREMWQKNDCEGVCKSPGRISYCNPSNQIQAAIQNGSKWRMWGSIQEHDETWLNHA